MITRRKAIAMMAAIVPTLGLPAFGAPLRWNRDRIIARGLSSPVGMAFDREGRLLVANWSVGTVVSVATTGDVSVLAVDLNGPSGLALGPNGDIYVASYSGDLIWKISRSGQREVFVRGLGTPAGLSFDLRGRLLIANRRTNQILTADPQGRLSVAVEGELQTPVGAVQLADGSYFVSNLNGGVSFAGSDGRARTVSREFAQPGPGIGIADENSVYVVDYGGTEVKQVGKDGRTQVVANGLRSPVGLAISADRSAVVVADWGTNTAYGFRVATT
jgi:sugar lactone lactonase YvrE